MIEHETDIRFTQGVAQVEDALELRDIYGITPEPALLENMSSEELADIQSACENLATACALAIEERKA